MKNKIVRVVVVLLSLILLVCPLLNVGASAYDIPGEIQFAIYNPLNLPNAGISALCPTFELVDNVSFASSYLTFGSIGCVVVENGVLAHSILGEYNLSTIISPMLDDGVYIFVCVLYSSDGYVFRPELNDGSYRTYTSVNSKSETGVVQVVTDDYNINLNMDTINHDGDMYTIVLYDMGTYFNNNGGGTPSECPTLQEQIQDYNGTWADFQGMMSTNLALYEDFLEQKRLAYNDGIDFGQQDIITSINTNNDFLSLMDTFLNYGMNNTRSVIQNQMDNVYQNGIVRGNEEGFNDGYNRGYNKGTSEVFGENILGETFNAPLQALNQWVLFETPGGLEVTMGGLFTAVIALAVLIIFLKMFAGG